MPPLVPGHQSPQRYLVEQYRRYFFLVFFLHTTEVSALYAGSSLWISPSKCLGLEPKWRWPLWNSKTAHATPSCLRPNDGVSGDLWEWTFFKHQHSPSVPQIAILSDMRVAVLLKKYSNLLPITLIRSHSTIAKQRYSSLLPHRILLVDTHIASTKGTKVPGSNHVGISCP